MAHPTYVTLTFASVTSTQDVAAEEARRRGSDVLVVAAEQTRGRGRSGHRWESPTRGMFASLAFRPDWPPATWARLALCAGLAARGALVAELGATVGLKWPNDLMMERGKVGGILAEAEGDLVAVGCGLNLWWPDPVAGASALYAHDPGEDAAGRLARAWVERLLAVVAEPADAWPVDAYRAVCVTLGRGIAWDPDGEGVAVDIDADGGLVVDTTSGRRTLTSGEVRLIRPATVPPEAG